MALLFNGKDVVRELGFPTVEKGRAVRASGFVKQVTISGDGSRITATVMGSGARPYRLTANVKPRAGGASIEGECLCPMEENCKHVAAALLECIERDKAPLNLDGGDAASAAPVNRHATAVTFETLPLFEDQSRTALSPEITAWLDRIASAIAPQPAPSATPSPNQRELRYILNHADAAPLSPRAAGVRIRPVSVRLRKDRSFTDVKLYDPEGVTRPKEQLARFITEADIAILLAAADWNELCA